MALRFIEGLYQDTEVFESKNVMVSGGFTPDKVAFQFGSVSSPAYMESSIIYDLFGSGSLNYVSGTSLPTDQFAAHGVAFKNTNEYSIAHHFTGSAICNYCDCIPIVAEFPNTPLAKSYNNQIANIRILNAQSVNGEGYTSWNNIVYFSEFNQEPSTAEALFFGFMIWNNTDKAQRYSLHANYQVRRKSLLQTRG